MLKVRNSIAGITLWSAALQISTVFAAVPLDPLTIPKYVTPLNVPPAFAPTVVTNPVTGAVTGHDYKVDVTQFQQQVLPAGFPQTTVWGYGGNIKNAAGTTVYSQSFPAATFNATRGVPVNVQWVNNLVDSATGAPLPHLFPVDPTLHWADPNNMGIPVPPFAPEYPAAQSPVPIVTHLHGGEVESASDGNPQAWFTPGQVMTGPSFVKSLYTYPNTQPAATLWYHDHTLGITRQNVYAGLAGFYLLRDPADTLAAQLPSGKYDVPLVIQDRLFNTDGSLNFPSVGVDPDVHPYWSPETFGDTIVVNGKTWPNMNVERRAYRFRLLNGSNARVYTLSLSNGKKFTQIASDGGYLPVPAKLSSLTLAPGERAEVIIDFSTMDPGKIIVRNSAAAPFPNGVAADPLTVGQIMQFTALPGKAVGTKIPAVLNTMPALTANAPTRTLTLNEAMGPLGPVAVLLNGQMFDGAITELPRVGSTEIWEVVNMTADTHPIHLHLVQFQVLSRQAYDTAGYAAAWDALNGGGTLPLMVPTVPLPPAAYLLGTAQRPAASERGWKDTVRMNPGEVIRIVVRYAPVETPVATAVPGANLYAFDPSAGPGYVWHCHILEHEDNEMMRPLQVLP